MHPIEVFFFGATTSFLRAINTGESDESQSENSGSHPTAPPFHPAQSGSSSTRKPLEPRNNSANPEQDAAMKQRNQNRPPMPFFQNFELPLAYQPQISSTSSDDSFVRRTASSLAINGFSNYAPTVPAVPDPSFNAYRQSLQEFHPASDDFMKNFKKGEHIHFKSDSVKINVWENGHDFLVKLGDFNEVHLFKNRDGLGMEVPENLDWSTIPQYINGEVLLDVINSTTQGTDEMKLDDLLEEFKKNERTNVLNLLSLEFSKTDSLLDRNFAVPEFVRKSSMIAKLVNTFTEKIEEIENKLNTWMKRRQRETLNGKKTALEDLIEKMPKYQKFLLLSMKDSFTNIHVDFSASSVYYHVKKGKKVFYVAEPTEKNLRTYKKFEKAQRGTEGKWIGDTLFEEWRRVEINEGETAMIPSGYIHFVYTPEDSIVVGGNFLLEKYAERQFELTTLEEKVVENEKDLEGGLKYEHLFRGFWSVMYSYLENCVLPEFEAAGSSLSPEQTALGKSFKKYLNPDNHHNVPSEDDWYTVAEKKKIMEKLDKLMPKKQKRQAVGTFSNGPVAKKQK